MALICGFVAIFGAAAPAGAATESFTLSSATLPGQDSVTWQGPPVNPPSTPNVFPSTVTLSGQIDLSTGDISAATLALPAIPITGEGQNTLFAFTEVNPGTATGNFNSSTDAVQLNDSLTLTFSVPDSPVGLIECVSTPINVAFSGTWDSTTQDVTLAASGFTIPQFPTSSGAQCTLAASSLNASPGGTAGSVGNAFSLALNGQFAPGLPTTTALSVSPPSPQLAGLAGTPVTLTATVTDPSGQGTPAGTVNFLDNGQQLGSADLSSGQAIFDTSTSTTSGLAQTTNQLTAVYVGGNPYAGSTSAAVPYTVQPQPTITTTFPSQMNEGADTFPTPTPFSLTITNPVGGATFTNNLFLYLGIGTNGAWNQKKAANYIQFSYQDSAGNWCPLAMQTSGPSNPSLPFTTYAGAYLGGPGAATCQFSPSFSLSPGQSLTLQLEVAFNADGDPLYGALQFAAALETGSCTSSSSCTAVAPLEGDNAQTSVTESTLVNESAPGSLPTEINDDTWPGNGGTVRSGNALWLYVGVVANTAGTPDRIPTSDPTGTVQFYLDGALVLTQPLTKLGAAEGPENYYPSPALAPGTHTITANYSGDLTFAPSTATETFTVIGPAGGTPYTCVVSPPGEAALTYNGYVTVEGNGVPTAATSGTSVTATNVSVTLNLDPDATNPTELNDDQANQTIGFSPGTPSVSAGSATFTEPSPPTDLIGTWSGLSTTVTVTGNPGAVVPVGVSSISFSAATSVDCTPVSQPATIGSVTIIGTTLAVSPQTSAPAGAPVTLTATVAPLPLTATYNPGQVDFFDGSTYLGTAQVFPTTATASLTVNTLSVGDHQFSAVWSGWGLIPPSTSNTVDYAVGTTTTTTLISSANPANAANPVTFTATVSPPPGATTEPTGDVSFTQDGNPITSCASQPLSMASPPTATCTVSYGAGQTHSIVATYSGDETYLGSVSAPLTQTTLSGTTTTIISTKDPSLPGNVTFWAGVASSSGTGAVPTGTVAFSVDGKTYAPCSAQPLGAGGGASCTVSFKANTTHKVSATYPGSASYSGSTSNTITQTVTGSSGSTKPKTTGGSATLAWGKTLTAGQSLTAGAYRLTMQVDGNLVEYQGTKARWASGTSGHPGTGVVMQPDGNLVEYNHGHAIWASKTAGHPSSHLTLQDADGNVVIYTPAGHPVWATGT